MWSQIIETLIAAGHTEKSIADKVFLSQPVIHRIKIGQQKSVKHDVGVKLLKLHRKAKKVLASVPSERVS
jgi:hypothetical protein